MSWMDMTEWPDDNDERPVFADNNDFKVYWKDGAVRADTINKEGDVHTNRLWWKSEKEPDEILVLFHGDSLISIYARFIEQWFKCGTDFYFEYQ